MCADQPNVRAAKVAETVDLESLSALAHAYRPRPVVALGTWRLERRIVKAYCILARPTDPMAAQRVHPRVAEQLAGPRHAGSLGLEVSIFHRGLDGDYLVVQSWAADLMTRLSVLIGPPGEPEKTCSQRPTAPLPAYGSKSSSPTSGTPSSASSST